MPTILAAQGITVEQASSELVNESYLLDARINFSFDKKVLEALEHGVALNIDIIIRVKQKRVWIWDPIIRENILKLKLEYHPLSDHYLLTNLTTGNRYQHRSLEQALTELGTINDHILINSNMLKDDTIYKGFIKAKLNIENLPPPLRPVAYISKQWQLKSPWYQWVVI